MNQNLMHLQSFNTPLPKLLLRADSGSKEGHGHRTRIEALATFVATRGYDYRIVSRRAAGTRPDVVDLNPILWLPEKMNNFDPVDLEALDAKEMLDILERNQFSPDIIIVDSYQFGSSWGRFLKSLGYYVVAFDDFRDRDHGASLVIEFLPPPCRVGRLCGLEFIPVDREFERHISDLPPIGWKVLVSFGGADRSDHTELALIALDQLCEKHPDMIWSVDVVLPQGLSKAKDLTARYSENKKFIFYSTLPSLAPLMHKCDIILTSGGNTMIESIVAKRACMAVITADNQAAASEYLESQNLIMLLGQAAQVGVPQIIQGLMTLPNRFRAEMSEALKTATIDAKGAERLLLAIYSKWEVTRHAHGI
jgi:spore coat polysaccharide biosynthesis predicted glycosyltransferase SpsG